MLLNKPIPIEFIINTVKHDLAYVSIASLIVLFISKELLPEIFLTIPAFIGKALGIAIHKEKQKV